MDARAVAALRAHLLEGQVIPAHPLALRADRTLDERSQRALTRYYVEAGAGGLAVGVHTTQFAIRDRGLYEPVLALAREEAGWGSRVAGGAVIRDAPAPGAPAPPRPPTLNPQPPVTPFALVAGLVGRTAQALNEARIATDLGYQAGLLSLAAWRDEPDEAVVAHCREVAAAIPLFGFYLQPAVGGRPLGYSFWRAFAEIERVVAIKIAPFDRYATLDVVRAVADAGRDDIALYTGNDDAIVSDLTTPFPVGTAEAPAERRIVGGLLGHWAVWTRAAVALLERARRTREAGSVPADLLRDGAAVTEMNAAVFDARNAFAGCIPGIMAVLRRQGLVRGTWCLDPDECPSPGQREAIARVAARYPHLTDDAWVAERRDAWMG